MKKLNILKWANSRKSWWLLNILGRILHKYEIFFKIKTTKSSWWTRAFAFAKYFLVFSRFPHNSCFSLSFSINSPEIPHTTIQFIISTGKFSHAHPSTETMCLPCQSTRNPSLIGSHYRLISKLIFFKMFPGSCLFFRLRQLLTSLVIGSWTCWEQKCSRNEILFTIHADMWSLHIWNLLTDDGHVESRTNLAFKCRFPLHCLLEGAKKNQFGSFVETRNLFVRRFAPHKKRVKSWINMIYIVPFLHCCRMLKSVINLLFVDSQSERESRKNISLCAFQICSFYYRIL